MGFAKKMSDNTIEVENVGAVEQFKFDLPEEGGIVVLLAENGAGKSTILHAAEVALTGKGSIPKRDKTQQGVFKAFGRELRVKKKTVKKGDLEWEGVGDFDVMSLHTPRYDNPVTRDKTRIKSLLRLSGSSISIDEFKKIVGDDDEFDRAVGQPARESDDAVEMAALVKKDLEAKAREYKKQSEPIAAEAATLKARSEGVDLEIPCDEKELDDAHHDAIRNESALRSQIESAEQAKEKRRQVEEKLDGMEMKPVDELKAASEAKEGEHQALKNEKAEIEAQMEELRKQLVQKDLEISSSEGAAFSAKDELLNAEEHNRVIEELRESLSEMSDLHCPTEDDLKEAAEQIKSAKSAVEKGMVIRAAKKDLDDAKEKEAEAGRLIKLSEMMRTAARNCESVLSEAVGKIPDCPLRVEPDDNGDSRLVIKTDRKDDTFFDELSDGERWRVIVPMTMGEHRVVVLPQQAYGELQPKNRKELHELALEHQCCILTAQAADGEMRAEAYSE